MDEYKKSVELFNQFMQDRHDVETSSYYSNYDTPDMLECWVSAWFVAKNYFTKDVLSKM